MTKALWAIGLDLGGTKVEVAPNRNSIGLHKMTNFLEVTQ